MIKRITWAVIGAAAAIAGARFITKKLEIFTPDGMSERASGFVGTVRDFGVDVKEGMNQREEELRAGLFDEDPDR